MKPAKREGPFRAPPVRPTPPPLRTDRVAVWLGISDQGLAEMDEPERSRELRRRQRRAKMVERANRMTPEDFDAGMRLLGWSKDDPDDDEDEQDDSVQPEVLQSDATEEQVRALLARAAEQPNFPAELRPGLVAYLLAQQPDE